MATPLLYTEENIMIENIEKKLYDIIGKRIKRIAIVTTIVFSIISVIAGIIICVNQGFEYGWVFIFLYPILILISSFVLYGFGELVDKVTKIEQVLIGTKQNDSEKEEKPAIEQSSDENGDSASENGEVS